MADIAPINRLNEEFYDTPMSAHQIMTTQHWKETAMATQCRIIANGETYKLHAVYISGGLQEVTARPPYWENGKPQSAKTKK